MLTIILKQWKLILLAISIIITYISLHQRNVLANENKTIVTQINSLTEITKNISTINQKQNEIATSTNVNIASIHSWLLELSAGYKS
jgi:hypothetical protein